MSSSISRRRFIGTSAAVSQAALVATASAQSTAASEKIVIGVMGLSRGRSLSASFAKRPNVEIKYVCDVDSQRAESCADLVMGAVNKKPQAIGDFRRILDDPDVDALVCSAPNHWHAPATIFACQAGKHVYVEKPCSHNPQEGEWMVEAARKHKRAVQMGTQRRSGATLRKAMAMLSDGVIGKVYHSRAFYFSLRGSIGTGAAADVPAHLDYDLWQGPAPRTDYMSNRVHYNWHWFWHWGNGELGNNGVHSLDVCRWGLGVDYPTRISSVGGRYAFQDDQQTPDTQTVSYEFADGKSITWQGLSCNRNGGGFVSFFGENGSMVIGGGGEYTIYDRDNKEVKTEAGSRGDVEHIDNFLAAIRNDKPLALNSEIAEGHKSTLLCHLGNISQRTGRTLECDPSNGHIQNDKVAMELWRRNYDKKFEPKV
jgi:predicted dehydrogenase